MTHRVRRGRPLLVLRGLHFHYAYADRGEHEIRIALEKTGGDLRATIEDDGRPFNPLEKEPPARPRSLEAAGIGGWGIPIVKAFADDLSYERRDGRNRFTILSRAEKCA
ncbi:MAG TPA: ATP-binding protein [Thermoanaerobaculia bacterium]|nr:ATP-binding protein [Thermoanaerobaculia bacterium]